MIFFILFLLCKLLSDSIFSLISSFTRYPKSFNFSTPFLNLQSAAGFFRAAVAFRLRTFFLLKFTVSPSVHSQLIFLDFSVFSKDFGFSRFLTFIFTIIFYYLLLFYYFFSFLKICFNSFIMILIICSLSFFL